MKNKRWFIASIATSFLFLLLVIYFAYDKNWLMVVSDSMLMVVNIDLAFTWYKRMLEERK